MLDTKERVAKFDRALSAFLSLEADQLPELCKALTKKNIFINISVSYVGMPPENYGSDGESNPVVIGK